MSKVSVAIFGIGGSLGKPIIDAFETGKFDDKIELPIKVVTRKELPSTDRIQYIVGNLDDELVDSLAQKLDGTDAVSYTHLDVYKRQVLHCLHCSLMFACRNLQVEIVVLQVQDKRFHPPSISPGVHYQMPWSAEHP